MRKPPVNPNKWGFFGGGSEDEDRENPVATWQRELREELGITVQAERIVPLWNYALTSGKRRYVFYCEWLSAGEDFVLGEGAGLAWFTLEDALLLPDLTEMVREDLLLLQDRGLAPGSC